MWCAEESGCTDDSGRGIPFKACQLKREPMQAWGLPSASMAHSMKVANSYSGYIKRERDTALPLRRGQERMLQMPSLLHRTVCNLVS